MSWPVFNQENPSANLKQGREGEGSANETSEQFAAVVNSHHRLEAYATFTSKHNTVQ